MTDGGGYWRGKGIPQLCLLTYGMLEESKTNAYIYTNICI